MNESGLGEADMIHLCTSDCDHEFQIPEVKFLPESAPIDARDLYKIIIM